MSTDFTIREARLEDMAGLLKIYNSVIETSTAIYMDEPLPLANREAWFQQRQKEGYPIFVAEDAEGIAGFGSFGDFRPFPGYRFTVEHSIHIRDGLRGKGLGQQLMLRLLERAKALGKHTMLGVIDGDNAGSINFHAKLGFEQSAFMPQVGFKFGRWLNIVIMQRFL